MSRMARGTRSVGAWFNPHGRRSGRWRQPTGEDGGRGERYTRDLMTHDTDPFRAVQAARLQEPDAPPDDDLVLVLCIGPHQINRIEGSDEVTVTYPVGADPATVLSAQPGGGWLLVPFGTAGPYERALVKPEEGRVVFAPQGSAGHAFVLPYTDTIPNV